MRVQKLFAFTGHNSSIFALSPAGTGILSAAGDGWVAKWNFDNHNLGELIAQIGRQIFSMLYLHDRDQLWLGNMDGGLHWIDLKMPDKVKNISHHKAGIFAITQVEDMVLTLGGDGLLTQWNAHLVRSVSSFQLSYQSLRCCDLHPDGHTLAIGGSDCNIYILDLRHWMLVKTLSQAHSNSVFSVRFSPDGRFLWSGGRDAELKIWEVELDYSLKLTQPAHWFTINDIIFSPCARWAATASRDKTVKIWDTEQFELLKVLEGKRDNGHVNSVNVLLWMDDRLLSAGDDRSIIVWQVQD